MSEPSTGISNGATAGPSRVARPMPPAFRPAASLIAATNGTNGSSSASLRNASSSGGSSGSSAAAAEASSSTTSGSSGAAGTSGTSGTTPSSASSGGPAEGETPAVPAGPVKPVHRSVNSKNAIIYSAVQRGNPVLKAIKNVPQELGDIPADYQVGTHTGVLFLSLKYHRLHPEYIHGRIEKMRNIYNLRVLIILCDVSEHQQSLRELTKIAIVNNLSTIVAWSNDEIAQYLTTFKQFEHKSADTLKEKVHQTYHDQLQHVLTSGKKVNKTDAVNLASQFGSFASMSAKSPQILAGVKGLGKAKVDTLHDAFSKPFLVGGLKRSAGRDASSSSAGSQQVPVIPEVGATSGRSGAPVNGRAKGKGREKKAVGVDGDVEPEEQVGSPDWPSNPSEDEDDEDDSAGATRRQPTSPSPGLTSAPDLGDGAAGTGAATGAWRDPLEDDEEDDGEDSASRSGGDGVEAEGRAKRRRTSRSPS